MPYRLFEFLGINLGFRNADQTFQRYIDLLLVFPFVNDILLASSYSDEHVEHLKIVFDMLQQYLFRLNLQKCKLGVAKLIFLGR